MPKRTSHKTMSFWSILFRVAITISAISLFISYFSIFINPAKVWFLSIFGLYYIPIVIVNVALLTIAVFRLSTSAWLPIVVLIPSLFFIRHFVGFNSDKIEHIQKVDSQEKIYKVMTYNVGQFKSSGVTTSKKECIRHIEAFLQGENPDVVCFQEFYTSDPANISSTFPGYPYKHSHLVKVGSNYYFGNVIMSKNPIINSGVISFAKSTNLSIYADINFGENQLRVYNNHLESYSISPSALIKRIEKYILNSSTKNSSESSNAISEELKSVHKKMKTSNIRRAAQVDSVLNHIQRSKTQAVICGDFNDTPMSYTYQQLKKVSKDTFLEAGRGFSSTYSFLWPLLRIDYILVPQSYDVISHITPKNRYSDHYPVITKIVKNDERGH